MIPHASHPPYFQRNPASSAFSFPLGPTPYPRPNQGLVQINSTQKECLEKSVPGWAPRVDFDAFGVIRLTLPTQKECGRNGGRCCWSFSGKGPTQVREVTSDNKTQESPTSWLCPSEGSDVLRRAETWDGGINTARKMFSGMPQCWMC